MKNLIIDVLPVVAILSVVFSMSIVDIVIIGDPWRLMSTIPILFIVILWGLATFRIRRRKYVH